MTQTQPQPQPSSGTPPELERDPEVQVRGGETAESARPATPTYQQIEAFGYQRFTNREQSRLDFGSRLLDLAEDDGLPLMERAKFLAIFSELLDEFYQIRVAALEDQVAAGVRTRSVDGLRPGEQLSLIRGWVEELVRREDSIFLDKIVPALAAAGIRLSDWSSLDDDDREHLVDVYQRQIYPILTPLAVDPGHPFPGMDIGHHHAFRVTRNADLALEEDEADDLLVAIEMELRRRRFGKALRLEVEADTSQEIVDLLATELEIGRDGVFRVAAPIDLSGLWGVYALDRPDLHAEMWTPMTPPRLAQVAHDPGEFFAMLRERDVLVHHPYDSFATSVEAFVEQAANDPAVLGIKQTL